MSSKIYIAGCGGMLGSAFYEIFSEEFTLKCSDIDVNEDWLSYLDFRDYKAYSHDVNEFLPDYLVHLGAYTDLEYCEANELDTFITNTISVEHAVKISNEHSIPLIFISTAGIFDGSKEYFDDWDSPNPMGIYARSKFAAERYVIENANQYFIFRAGWMMGGGPRKDKKFINKIYQQIWDGKDSINIVDDKDGTPTYTVDFAKNVLQVIRSEHSGLFNLVCSGQTSRTEVAEELLRLLGLESKVTINHVSSDFFKSTYFAERPSSERLINRRLDLLGLNIMRDWREALKDYVESEFKKL